MTPLEADLTGRTIVITGASAGIGAAAARRLHASGATVAVVGRNPEKTAAVARDLGVDPLIADFADLSQVRRLAAELLERYPRIDVLANNAGGTWPKRVTTVDGHELTFQANHLAPYLLTRLLRDRLTESGAAIISTSSAAHGLGRVRPDDLDTVGRYSGMRVYGTTKLENILFTRELQRRWGPDGISAAAFHPGVVASEFARDSFFTGLLYRTPARRLIRGVDGGADTLVWLAATSDWLPGAYYSDRKETRTSKAAHDDAMAVTLWDRSAKLVGLQP